MTPNSDPVILLSFINTKLRDQYKTLDLLCDDLSMDQKALADRLAEIDYFYSKEQNQFI